METEERIVVNVERLCKWCGVAFVANHGRKVYCSPQCSKHGLEEYQREYQLVRLARREEQWDQESDAEQTTPDTSIEEKLSEYFGIKELDFEALKLAITGGRSPKTALVITDDFSITYTEGCVSCYDIATQRRHSWVA